MYPNTYMLYHQDIETSLSGELITNYQCNGEDAKWQHFQRLHFEFHIACLSFLKVVENTTEYLMIQVDTQNTFGEVKKNDMF